LFCLPASARWAQEAEMNVRRSRDTGENTALSYGLTVTTTEEETALDPFEL
jgi:hypothetical protein